MKKLDDIGVVVLSHGRLNKLEFLNEDELKLLSDLFNEVSDANIFNILINKIASSKKFKNLIDKILDE